MLLHDMCCQCVPRPMLFAVQSLWQCSVSRCSLRSAVNDLPPVSSSTIHCLALTTYFYFVERLYGLFVLASLCLHLEHACVFHQQCYQSYKKHWGEVKIVLKFQTLYQHLLRRKLEFWRFHLWVDLWSGATCCLEAIGGNLPPKRNWMKTD